jgi:alkylation response protein AidB-like acyl-CoA dehydrogenase
MDFGFNDDQELLRATTRRFLTEHQPLARVRQRLEEPDVFEAELWREGAALGWTAMLVPPELEGGTLTTQPLVDLVVLAEELGRALNPGPFVPCNVVADAIVRFGSEAQAQEWLPRIARGDAVAAWCLSADGSPDSGAVGIQARRERAGWSLDGTARYVNAAQNADVLLVVAADASGAIRNFLVPRPSDGLSVRVVRGLDLTRRFAEVSLDGVVVPAAAELPGGRYVVDRCLSMAIVLQAGESVGAGEVLFESLVDYLKRRVQFGRTIASFQAVKHRLANLQVELEGMRVAAEYAALAFGDGLDDAAEAVATAGAYVGDAFAHLCGEALQLFGGIGFTWEHDVHLFVRRAKVNQVLYGGGAFHRERLVRLIEAAVDQLGLVSHPGPGD